MVEIKKNIIIRFSLLVYILFILDSSIYAKDSRDRSLRVPLKNWASEKSITFPLTPDFIHSRQPELSIQGYVETFRGFISLKNTLIADGYRLERVDEQYLVLDRSRLYSLGRLNIRTFQPKGEENLHVLSITNEDGRTIGHGVIRYFSHDKSVRFRYAIHVDFRNNGYGTETLVLIMAICVNGKHYGEKPIEKFGILAAIDDYTDYEGIGALFRLVRSAGFINGEFSISGNESTDDTVTEDVARYRYSDI